MYRKGDESRPLDFGDLSRDPQSLHRSARPGLRTSGGRTSPSSLPETLAGGGEHRLLRSLPALEKPRLGICTEQFVVGAALIPRESKAPWEKPCCSCRTPGLGDGLLWRAPGHSMSLTKSKQDSLSHHDSTSKIMLSCAVSPEMQK